MTPLETYLTKWNLSDPEQIADTHTGYLYKVKQETQTCALKILKPTTDEDEKNAAYFLSTCKGQGVVDIFDHDDNALLINYINGPMLRNLCEDDRDDEATKIIGETLNKIHATPIPNNHPFMNLHERFQSLFNHAPNAPNIIKRGAKFATHLLQNQKDICLLHGDIHHENILYDKKLGEWQAIDPKGIVGERAYDCANTLRNPDKMPKLTENKNRLIHQSKILSEITGIDPQAIIHYAFAHSCLSACWSMEDDGHYPTDTLTTAGILEDLTDLDYVK